jgi:hypothetical protein
VTSFASAGSPFGSGMFQFMSNAVRSTVVVRARPRRVAPKWSTAGPVAVPFRIAGRVMPLIVISPSISTSSPVRRISREVNVTSGWRSASKNSGPSTLALIAAGSTTEMESTRADPSSSRAPPSPRSVAVTSDSEPRYQKTPEWRTANAKLEGTGWAR